MGERATELTLRLRMAPQYVLGPPCFVELTLGNETEGAEYYDLLHCNPLSPPFPVELTFVAGETSVALPAKFSAADEASQRGFRLAPGQARTFVVDFSELEPRLAPGDWQCQGRWLMPYEEPRSAPIAVRLAAAPPEDLAILRRLRHAGGARSPGWANLIKSREVLEQESALEGLSEQASRALVPYLILHQMVHGPDSLAQFPPDVLSEPQREGPWASEAAVLAYELQWARRASDLPQRERELLQRWPGVAFRVEEIKQGAGLLTRLRGQYGPDQPARP
jgi:hypothetical protein